MDFLRSQFAEFAVDPADVEARSTLAFTLAIGNHFMAADHGPRTRKDVMELAANLLGV
jgi:hypothetical protein